MASKSPLAVMKEAFGEKSKLVEAVEKLVDDSLWLARVNEKKGLAHVSNAKLLRLHATFSEVKEKFGSRDKLIDAILELEKRSKDADLRQKLEAWPVPRLYDAYRSAAKRASAGAPAKKAKAPRAESKAEAAGQPRSRAAGAKKSSKPAKKAATKASAAKGAKKKSAKKGTAKSGARA
ncbi:MAG: hypothetical protein JOZ69_15350 [Myxococcales bacterium]|nr:hypothetical protein [Myxococcales bacterium]